MSFFDFSQIVFSATAVVAWIAFTMCMIAPHPVVQLKIATIGVAAVSSCVAVALCTISTFKTVKMPSSACKQTSSASSCTPNLRRKSDINEEHRGSHDKYHVVDEHDPQEDHLKGAHASGHGQATMASMHQ